MAEKFRTELQDVLEVMVASGNLDISKRKTLQFPCHFTKKFEEQDIEFITGNPRAVNAMKREGVFTIGQLIEKFDELKKVRNVGAKSLQILRVSLIDYYYQSLETAEAKAKFIKEVVEMNSGLPDPIED